MEDLHEDIRLEIFSRLPPEPLLKCKLVCKTWENLLSPKKVGILFLFRCEGENNLQLYYADYDEFSDSDEDFSYRRLGKIEHPGINLRRDNLLYNMVGSCNGLVCFCIPHHRVNDPVYICNPITTEYINLPRLEIKYGLVISGFGYHLSSNTYKVVRIHYTDRFRTFEPVTKGSVAIYTLGNGTGWRNIGEITYKLCDTGVLANGSLYWLEYEQKRIVVFSLGDEHFRCLPTIPQCFHDSENATYHVKVLGGDLCLVHVDVGKHVDIWSYKNKQKRNDSDNDKEEGYQSWSWSLEFRIPCTDPDGEYEPFALTKKNEVLLWLNRTCLCCYDKMIACTKLWRRIEI